MQHDAQCTLLLHNKTTSVLGSSAWLQCSYVHGKWCALATRDRSTVTISLCKVICPQLRESQLARIVENLHYQSIFCYGNLVHCITALSVRWQGRKNDSTAASTDFTVQLCIIMARAEVRMVAGNQMKSFMMMMAITGFLSNVAFLKYGCERLPSLNLKKI